MSRAPRPMEKKVATNQKCKMKRGVLAIIIILVIVAAAVGGYLFLNKDSDKTEPRVPQKTALINPLTGLEAKNLLDKPLMFSTDNDSYLARPQSSIGKADVVYEVPIEGGGSRFEMIFYENLPGKVGPLRSARPYIVDIAREYNAILIHNGWSQDAKMYLESGVVDYIPGALNWEYFYRSDDRNIPHNCYTEGDKILKCAKKKGYTEKSKPEAFEFLQKGDKVEGKDANVINCDYVETKNQYIYNKEEKKYARYTGGDAFTDKETGKQIKCANVVFQKVNIKVLDDQGRLAINMTEGGEATVFTRGKAISATWSRDSLDGRTTFKDQNGQTIKLSPGVTFFQVTDYTVKTSWSK
ncbi:MAG: DUF3048 domain-containing protein [Anaerovoracaceae bacterium]